MQNHHNKEKLFEKYSVDQKDDTKKRKLDKKKPKMTQPQVGKGFKITN